jgi:hypothetical protein
MVPAARSGTSGIVAKGHPVANWMFQMSKTSKIPTATNIRRLPTTTIPILILNTGCFIVGLSALRAANKCPIWVTRQPKPDQPLVAYTTQHT